MKFTSLQVWALSGVLALVAGVVVRARILAYLRRDRLTDDMVRQIEEQGRIVVDAPEPLDHEQIREEEARFWEESSWDEADEF